MRTLARWRRAAGVCSVVVAVGVLGACGDSDDDSSKDSSAADGGGDSAGDSGSPEDASEEDFCKAVLDAPGEDVDAIHAWGEELSEVGTPEDIPDDARQGFELLVDLAAEIDEDDLAKGSLEDEFSDEEKEHFEAYGAYIGETCAPAAPDLGTEMPEPDAEAPTD